MKQFLNRSIALVALPFVFAFAAPQLAVAGPGSTAIIAGAAAVIVGSILYDGNHRPYYRDSSGRSHYVSVSAANYYNQHHWNQTPQNQRRWQDQGGTWHNGR